jgi:pSer/pThr/pTyr-binding forkhead associated (FHA) protein
MGSAETMFMDGTPTDAAAPPAAHAVKLVMLGQDGNPMGERLLRGESLEVGRNAGPPWDDDAYLDPKHAALTPAADGVHIEDFGSLNGVYIKLKTRTELRDGDQFRVGQELLYYEDLPEPTQAADGSERMGSPNPGYWGRVSVLVDPERAVRALPIAGSGISIGRELGDMTFPGDGYVSGTHCRVVGDDSGVYLEDVGSSNGTYIRARSGDTVPFGSLILIGQKLFQIEKP